MAESTCPKCSSISFEAKHREKSNFLFVQCSECGCVVGVLNTPHTDKQFEAIISKQNHHENLLVDILNKVLQILIKPR